MNEASNNLGYMVALNERADAVRMQLRIRCLELAVGRPCGDPVETATRYLAFVTGEGEAGKDQGGA